MPPPTRGTRTGFDDEPRSGERSEEGAPPRVGSLALRVTAREMGLRHWLRQQLGGSDDGEDLPPGRSLMRSLWGEEEQRVHALGEYDAATYPRELAELLGRRQTVSNALLEIDISSKDSRVAAIPRLRDMLRTYPHPLVYELLIHAYADAGRFDEARGLAFAARERRIECSRSEYPEIRSEIEHLSEWSVEDVEQLRSHRASISPG